MRKATGDQPAVEPASGVRGAPGWRRMAVAAAAMAVPLAATSLPVMASAATGSGTPAAPRQSGDLPTVRIFPAGAFSYRGIGTFRVEVINREPAPETGVTVRIDATGGLVPLLAGQPGWVCTEARGAGRYYRLPRAHRIFRIHRPAGRHHYPETPGHFRVPSGPGMPKHPGVPAGTQHTGMPGGTQHTGMPGGTQHTGMPGMNMKGMPGMKMHTGHALEGRAMGAVSAPAPHRVFSPVTQMVCVDQSPLLPGEVAGFFVQDRVMGHPGARMVVSALVRAEGAAGASRDTAVLYSGREGVRPA